MFECFSLKILSFSALFFNALSLLTSLAVSTEVRAWVSFIVFVSLQFYSNKLRLSWIYIELNITLSKHSKRINKNKFSFQHFKTNIHTFQIMPLVLSSAVFGEPPLISSTFLLVPPDAAWNNYKLWSMAFLHIYFTLIYYCIYGEIAIAFI